MGGEGEERVVKELVLKGWKGEKMMCVLEDGKMRGVSCGSGGWGEGEKGREEVREVMEKMERVRNGEEKMREMVMGGCEGKLVGKGMGERRMSYVEWLKCENGGMRMCWMWEVEEMEGGGRKGVVG